MNNNEQTKKATPKILFKGYCLLIAFQIAFWLSQNAIEDVHFANKLIFSLGIFFAFIGLLLVGYISRGKRTFFVYR